MLSKRCWNVIQQAPTAYPPVDFKDRRTSPFRLSTWASSSCSEPRITEAYPSAFQIFQTASLSCLFEMTEEQHTARHPNNKAYYSHSDSSQICAHRLILATQKQPVAEKRSQTAAKTAAAWRMWFPQTLCWTSAGKLQDRSSYLVSSQSIPQVPPTRASKISGLEEVETYMSHRPGSPIYMEYKLTSEMEQGFYHPTEKISLWLL